MKTDNKKIKINFEKIKDFFIVNFIRFKNLVKEHKYISSVSFLFLVSCVIAIVVFAESDDYAGSIESSIKGVTISKTEGLNDDEVYSFDTVTLNLEYILKNTKDEKTIERDFEIEAKICSGDNLAWKTCENSVDAFFDYGAIDYDTVNYSVGEDGNTASVKSYDVYTGEGNSHAQNVYLKTNNIDNDTKIHILFRARETTEGEENYKYITKTINVKSQKANLSIKAVGGSAYKLENNDRYAPFGILIGYDSDEDLKGKYFDTSQELKLSATSNGSVAELITDEKKYGIYEKDNLINIPNGKYDEKYANDSVYDSGEVTLKKQESDNITQNIKEVKSKALYLLGNKQDVITIGDAYSDPGVSLSSNGKKLSLDENNIIIYKDDEVVENIHDINDIEEAGNYKIKYTYKDSSYESSIYRNIKVEKKDSVTVDEKTYSLNGNSTVYLINGNNYTEPGILKDGKKINLESDSDVTIEVTKPDDFSENGGTIRYTIISNADDSNQNLLKRTVIIVKDEGKKSVEEYTLNDESIDNCKSNSICSIEYYAGESKIDDISKMHDGEYDIIYKLSDDDFEVILKSKVAINKEIFYNLNIKNYKIRSTNYKDGNFLVFGSYYVNVKSTRDDDNKEDIPVILTINDTPPTTITNPYESFGTKKLTMNFYDDFDQKIDTVAYGDEVVLKSNFTYSIDGDYSLKDFSLKIPINSGVFSLQAFSSEIESDNIYYQTSISDAIVTYYTKDNKEIENADEKVNAAYITYTLGNVKPGTEFDFSIRLKVKKLDDISKLDGISKITLKDVECNYTENDTLDEGSFAKDISPSLNINAFRANLDVEIDEADGDTIVNGVTQSKIVIYPEVIMPYGILNVSENLNLNSVTVTVTLPDKINYVYNESYIKPKINGKTLTYTYSGKKTNDEFDPIYIDVNYDIDIENETIFEVKTNIKAISGDVESSKEKTNNIIFENNDEIRASLSVSNKIVSKDKAFNVKFNSYNASTSSKEIGAVIVLPYNSDVESKKLFNGIYEVENIDDALCTTKDSSYIVSNSDKIFNEDIWNACNTYDSKDITAIKMQNTTGLKEKFNKEINIIPKENAPSDEYKFTSYIYDSGEKKSERTISVSVVTKMITGIIWEDFDEDGIMDDDENRVSGITLKLYNEKDELVTEAISNDKGKYSLYDLEAGNYYIIAEFDTDKYALTVNQSIFQTSDKDVIASEIIVTDDTKTIENINLGLALKKVYNIKLAKYISKVSLTNKLGISTVREFNNASLVKIDIKDLVNTHIKVVYLIELENVGYYPGYVNNVIDYIPDGMTFNEEYEENKNWISNENGYLENKSLSNEIMYSGDKKYLTVAFDVSRKEAGSFVNSVSVDKDDLKIYAISGEDIEDGDENEENE